jgi:signal transduction histidine kinase
MPEPDESAAEIQDESPRPPAPPAGHGHSRKLLPAVLLTLLVVLSIVLVTIRYSRNANREMFKLYQREQCLAAFHQAGHFRQRIEDLMGELQGLNLLIQRENPPPAEIDARLAGFLARKKGLIDGVGYLDAEGTLRNYRNADGPQPPADLRFIPQVRQALATRSPTVSDTLLTPDGITGLIVLVPMADGGTLMGGTMATISSQTVGRWLLRPAGDQHGFTLALDPAGVFLHHPDAQFVNTSIHAPPVPLFDGIPLADGQLRDGRAGNIEGRAFRSRTQVAGVAAATVQGRRFLFLSCAPYEVVAKPVLRSSRHTSILTGLTFLVTALGFVYAFYLFNLDKSALVQQSSELRQDIRRHQDSEELHQELIGQLEMKNAELERFAYTVSHDLKSPLITIRGFLGMLEKDIADGNETRIQADMSRIANATENMQRLLDELLELSRVGRLDNPLEDFSLNEVTDEVLELLAGRMQDRHIDIRIQPQLPAIHGDRPRFREVMQNLLENALKFMGDQEEPRIEVGVRQDEDEQVVFVQDNGIGLDMEYADRIFQLFEQLDPTFEGTGMGLAMVKRILEHAGSRIWVESEGPGTGCTFCFTLPPAPGGTRGT